MATAHDSHAEYHHGDMDVHEQAATFDGVIGLFKWGSLALASALILLVFWFCTPAGFLPGFVVALIVAILGIVFLREKKTAGH